MIHLASPKSRPAVISLDFEVLCRTDGRTDGQHNMCENSDHYRPGLWSASWINKCTLFFLHIFLFFGKKTHPGEVFFCFLKINYANFLSVKQREKMFLPCTYLLNCLGCLRETGINGTKR